jgi:D-arabinose 1-dehydrogenase-like Zn-dependent alcohol dehydrogenase
VAIARGKEKEELARRLGAHHYVDSQDEDVARALSGLGGAAVILATVTNASAMTAAIGGLGVRGKMVVVGASAEPIEVAPTQLIGGNRSIHGHASGASMDSKDTLAFSALTGVRPMIETMPLERAADAYERMMGNQARFRMVLVTGQ